VTPAELFFDWLEHTDLSMWVRGESMLTFPTILTIHVLGTGFLALVVLDVDDPALRVERSGQSLPLTALAATSAPASTVAPEAPPSSSPSATLAFRSLRGLAVSVQPGLRVTGVARLRRIG